MQDQEQQEHGEPSLPTSSASIAPTSLASEECTNTDPILIADITNFSAIQNITAPGSPSIEGPKEHSFVWTDGARVPLYALVDAVLKSGAYYQDSVSSPAQYLLFFAIKDSCNFAFKFDHIDEPVQIIRENLPLAPALADSRTIVVPLNIEFSAGDVIGYTVGTHGAGNWDFGLYNEAEQGALIDSYGMHSYAVCWVDFYAPEKQMQYRTLLDGPHLVCDF